VRGVAWPAGADVPYPRVDPDDDRLPLDTRQAAAVPAGVRLEVAGDADAIAIAYRTQTDGLGEPGEGAGLTFGLWRDGTLVAEEPAALGESVVRLPLGFAPPESPAVVHLPEGMRPTVLALEAVGGVLEPAPAQPRWLAYGDSITQGWLASAPGRTWPMLAAGAVGLDVINLGYAGAARGEMASAEQIAALEADVITIGFGTSCWERTPFSAVLMSATTTAFVATVRQGHPGVPIVVASPPLRPDAEWSPNARGATLADLRRAQEEAVEEAADGDRLITLVRGQALLGPEHLADDGVHPNDGGHRRIAAAMTEQLFGALC
jgi:lysophospholipase L1-like esterase